MSLPPFRAYAVVGMVLALIFGVAAWALWHHLGVAIGAGLVLGAAGLGVLVALSGRPKDPGPRDPNDPRA